MEAFAAKTALTEWANDHTMGELVALWNEIPGIKAVKKFENRDIAVSRIWAALEAVRGTPKAAAKKVVRKGKGKRAKLTRKTSAGGRAEEVLVLVGRAKGVTLAELMLTFQWLPHTARGFMSRLGDAHKIESFKPEGGARTYRLVSK